MKLFCLAISFGDSNAMPVLFVFLIPTFLAVGLHTGTLSTFLPEFGYGKCFLATGAPSMSVTAIDGMFKLGEKSVGFGMRTSIWIQFKILWSIIKNVTIYMMNYFIRGK